LRESTLESLEIIKFHTVREMYQPTRESSFRLWVF